MSKKYLDAVYQFSLTMNGDMVIEIFGEWLGKHLWNKYMEYHRDWLKWYGSLDLKNSEKISEYITQHYCNK